MDSLEPKKLALIRVLQVLQNYSDINHVLTQEFIAERILKDYGLEIERKAIGRNISLLKEAGFEIVSTRQGSYFEGRPFEDSELRLLIDSVLCSKHISPAYSKCLIEKLTGLSNKYFKNHIKNVYSINEWNKSQSADLFLNIELIDEAIENNRKLNFLYNKYREDKQLHSSSRNFVSPYQMVLKNQHYYLFAYNHKWDSVQYYRIDKITKMTFAEGETRDLRTIKGYENGIDYKRISSAQPYMYTDKPERVQLLVAETMLDQVIDWFGYDIDIVKQDNKFLISLIVSPSAMEYWAMQYLNYVEILKPESLREKIKDNLIQAMKKYN